MRTVRERPRLAVVVGWLALALVLAGALIGATASAGAGRGEREALVHAQRAAQDARAQADDEGRRADELVGALEAERGRVVALRGELRDARRNAPRRKSARNRR